MSSSRARARRYTSSRDPFDSPGHARRRCDGGRGAATVDHRAVSRRPSGRPGDPRCVARQQDGGAVRNVGRQSGALHDRGGVRRRGLRRRHARERRRPLSLLRPARIRGARRRQGARRSARGPRATHRNLDPSVGQHRLRAGVLRGARVRASRLLHARLRHHGLQPVREAPRFLEPTTLRSMRSLRLSELRIRHNRGVMSLQSRLFTSAREGVGLRNAPSASGYQPPQLRLERRAGRS